MFQAGLCGDGFTVNQHIMLGFVFVELEKYNLKKVGGTLVPSQLHLFSQMAVKTQILYYTYILQAEIPKIKTRRNLQSLHLECKVHLFFFIFYTGISWQQHKRPIYLMLFTHSKCFWYMLS